MDPPRQGNVTSRPGETPLPPDVHRPRGIFNKVMITPDEWRQVRDLMEILEVSPSFAINDDQHH